MDEDGYLGLREREERLIFGKIPLQMFIVHVTRLKKAGVFSGSTHRNGFRVVNTVVVGERGRKIYAKWALGPGRVWSLRT